MVLNPALAAMVSASQRKFANFRATQIATINAMPNVSMLSFKELGIVWKNEIDGEDHPPVTVELTASGLVVGELALGEAELFNCHTGVHPSYGNFALLWSVRGPGDCIRPRPCFLFCDGWEGAMV